MREQLEYAKTIRELLESRAELFAAMMIGKGEFYDAMNEIRKLRESHADRVDRVEELEETKRAFIREIKELRESHAKLLAALKRMVSEYGRQNEDALEQAEAAITNAEKLNE